jgi:hypothetical protein
MDAAQDDYNVLLFVSRLHVARTGYSQNVQAPLLLKEWTK